MKIKDLTMTFCLAGFFFWMNGCTATLEVDHGDLDKIMIIDPNPYLGDKPIGVENFEGAPETIHYYKYITRSLAQDYNVDLLRGDVAKAVQISKSCDYHLKIKVNPEFKGSWVNALLTFPGFIVFAPSWNGFYYTAILNTEVEISDNSGAVLATVVENPELGINHMDFGRSFWAYSGWWMPGLGATSLLTAPFMTGFDTDTSSPFLQKVGDSYGEYIADKIVATINRLESNKFQTTVSPATAMDG